MSYGSPDVNVLQNAIQTQLQIYGSMFGMATATLSVVVNTSVNEPSNATGDHHHFPRPPPLITGHGSMSNCQSGVYVGTFYYNDINQLYTQKSYRLQCTISEGTLNISFFPRTVRRRDDDGGKDNDNDQTSGHPQSHFNENFNDYSQPPPNFNHHANINTSTTNNLSNELHALFITQIPEIDKSFHGIFEFP